MDARTFQAIYAELIRQGIPANAKLADVIGHFKGYICKAK